MSVMEMSHRGKAFVSIAEAGRGRPARAAGRAEELQGAVPARRRHRAVRGRAAEPDDAGERRRLREHGRVVEEGASAKRSTTRKVNVAADAGEPYVSIPPVASWKRTPDAAYLHYTPNETIGGVEFHFVPDAGTVPLVADMSSTILSRPIDVVEVRRDLRRRAEEHRSGRPHARDRARRPARSRAHRPRPRSWTSRRWRRTARC